MLVLFDQVTPVPQRRKRHRGAALQSRNSLPANAVLEFETEADAKTAARLIKKAQARSADEKSGAEAPHAKKSHSESSYMECGGLTTPCSLGVRGLLHCLRIAAEIVGPRHAALA